MGRLLDSNQTQSTESRDQGRSHNGRSLARVSRLQSIRNRIGSQDLQEDPNRCLVGRRVPVRAAFRQCWTSPDLNSLPQTLCRDRQHQTTLTTLQWTATMYQSRRGVQLDKLHRLWAQSRTFKCLHLLRKVHRLQTHEKMQLWGHRHPVGEEHQHSTRAHPSSLPLQRRHLAQIPMDPAPRCPINRAASPPGLIAPCMKKRFMKSR